MLTGAQTNKQTNKQAQLTIKQKGNDFEIHKIFKTNQFSASTATFFPIKQTYSRLPIQ